MSYAPLGGVETAGLLNEYQTVLTFPSYVV